MSNAAPGVIERARLKAEALAALKQTDRRYRRSRDRHMNDAATRRADARAAHDAGASWVEVGEVLGVSEVQAFRLGTADDE